MNANHRTELSEALKAHGVSPFRLGEILAIVEEIEDKAFNAGRDSAPTLPGTADVVDRLEAVESALTELNPGWRYGAHRLSCTCSACQR